MDPRPQCGVANSSSSGGGGGSTANTFFGDELLEISLGTFDVNTTCLFQLPALVDPGPALRPPVLRRGLLMWLPLPVLLLHPVLRRPIPKP